MVLFKILILLQSCFEPVKISEFKLHNDKKYILDTFYVIDIYENLYTDYTYTLVDNDTIFILQKTEGDNLDYFEEWIIGSININSPRTLSLNKPFDITIINHLHSTLRGVEITTDGQKLFWLDIEVGTNEDINIKDSKHSLLFSQEKGIICLIKTDSLYSPPFY